MLLMVLKLSGQTVFEIGDVAILGINANNNVCEGASSGPDLISFVCFKDLTPGTTLDFTDNGWERLYEGYWGTTEGTCRIVRTGSTITAGTVITVRLDNNNITGIFPDSDWTSTMLQGTNLNMNTNGDQLFIMQGGTWSFPGGQHYGEYTGTVLFGFSTSTPGWVTFTGANLGAQQSVMYPGMPCFNMAPTAASDWSKFTGPFGVTTQRLWMERFRDSGNWSAFANCTAYNTGAPVYQTGFTIPFTGGGFNPGYWLGFADNDWFNCSNWENLLVPTEETEVLLRPLEPAEGPFEHALIDSPDAVCDGIDIMPGAELTIQASGELSVQDDLRNNGILNCLGTIILEGNSPGQLWGSGGITTRHLILNKTAGSGIQLDTLLTISANGSMTFNSGVVTPTPPNRVDFETNAQAIGASDASFIDGPVRKAGNQNFNFPTGTDGFYQPIGIENITPAGSEYEARFFNANGPGIYGYNWVPSINNVATCNYWTLDQISGTSARVRLSWGNDDDCEVNTPANLVVSRHDGAIWQNEGQLSFTGNAAAGSVLSLNAITDFSPFALASITNDNPLPVEWLNFTASELNDKVLLRWITATEINNDYFTVEHSTSATDFREIGQITGAGNSSTANQYEWIHDTPEKGSNYYRIRQTDFDGTTDYSSIEHVFFNGVQRFVVSANHQMLQIRLSMDARDVRVQMLNLAGQQLASASFGAGNYFEFDSGTLPKGMYIVRVVADGQILTGRVIF